jgi:TfoX/Sxy family transcriptional regulator of competence genes
MDKEAFKKKPPADLTALFDSVAPTEVAGVERRMMFGYPACFVNGNMFMSLFQDRMALRLSEQDRAELLTIDGATVFEPMEGRPMKEYVDLPAGVIGDRATLEAWVDRSVSYGSTLPPKAKKPKKPTSKRRT